MRRLPAGTRAVDALARVRVAVVVVGGIGRQIAQPLQGLAVRGCVLACGFPRFLGDAALREPALAIELRHRGLSLATRSHAASLLANDGRPANGPSPWLSA